MTPSENGNQQALEDIREQVRRLWAEKASAEALKYTVDALGELKGAVESIERTITGRAEQRVAEREAAARERKLDRRWMVGTILFATGLVISALAILLPTLSGGG